MEPLLSAEYVSLATFSKSTHVFFLLFDTRGNTNLHQGFVDAPGPSAGGHTAHLVTATVYHTL